MQAQNTGWRRAAAINHIAYPPHTEDKGDLFEAARLCCRVLNLPSSCRFILDQLCAAYGGKLIGGRIIVWPSNEYLSNRTGVSERTIRFAIRRLIDLEVIEAKDSPNGKRYARRTPDGSITEAYGFDLTPMVHRVSEFKDRLVAIKDLDRDRRAAFDELTIVRRNTQEIINRLTSEFPGVGAANLAQRSEALSRALPRRSSKVIPIDALRDWKKLHEEAKAMIIAASGGTDCRHKDTNKNPPDIPCNKGGEDDAAEAVIAACPDATELYGGFRFEEEMFEQADRYRGSLGLSQDVWLEARRKMGDVNAARLFYLVVQIQARPSSGAAQIRNLGGYYRAMMRKILDAEVSLDDEINRRRS